MPTEHIRFKKEWRAGLGAYEEPTYTGFTLLFFFDDLASPILSSEGNTTESAQNYFARRGMTDRQQMLELFKSNLQQVNRDTPHFWQSIEGMDMVDRYDFRKDEYPGGMIYLNTLESLDMRINALIDFYRHAVYDHEHFREMVPQNLRYFDMIVYLTEIRNFREITKASESQLESNIGDVEGFTTDVIDAINENSTSLLYHLKKCEFNIEESGRPDLGTIDNRGGEPAVNRLAIKYKRIEKISDYSLLDIVVDPNINRVAPDASSGIGSTGLKNPIKEGLGARIRDEVRRRADDKRRTIESIQNVIAPGDTFRERLNNFGQRVALNLADNILDNQEARRSLILGNVYSDRNRLLNALVGGSLGNALGLT